MQDIIFFINQNLILISIWVFFLIAVIFLMTKNIFLKCKIINNIKAIKLINKENAVVIDTRSEKFFKNGHIINSINLPLKKILLENIKEIELYKSRPIILILDEMYQYNKCVKKLLKYGFNDIYILKNGIYYWKLDHLPLISRDK